MVFLILLKWCIDWRAPNGPPATLQGQGPPSILNLMIQMFLSPHGDMQSRPSLAQYQLYNGQGYIQILLLLLAILMVPIMLLCKPLALKRDHDREQKEKSFQQLVEEEPDPHSDSGHEHGDEFEFTELLVHQAIHTIEFVLGAVSNTASYLRLWALSLAHAELSEVFIKMVLVRTLTMYSWGYGQFIVIFVGFAVWAALTVGVILGMESLSAFLHSLRLHWIEFQNKFYQGDGYKFTPFSYQAILEQHQIQIQ